MISVNSPALSKVLQALVPHNQKLFSHSLYNKIDTLPKLQIFMKNHVFAVWDFMSQLKFIQSRVTCVQSPWVPASHPSLSRFFNDIVLAEESDEVSNGVYMSHFELYLLAMKEVGADTSPILELVTGVRQGLSVQKGLDQLRKKKVVSEKTLEFVDHTFQVIDEGKLNKVAAYFLFGREDPIPEMFLRLSATLKEKGLKCPNFEKYLERHITLDQETHCPLSRKALTELAGEDSLIWAEIERCAVEAIQQRMRLWDGIHESF